MAKRKTPPHPLRRSSSAYAQGYSAGYRDGFDDGLTLGIQQGSRQRELANALRQGSPQAEPLVVNVQTLARPPGKRGRPRKIDHFWSEVIRRFDSHFKPRYAALVGREVSDVEVLQDLQADRYLAAHPGIKREKVLALFESEDDEGRELQATNKRLQNLLGEHRSEVTGKKRRPPRKRG